MTVQQLAQQLNRAFTRAVRQDGTTYIKLRNGSPGWMNDVIRECHCGRLPNDRVYSLIEQAAEYLANYTGSDLTEAINYFEPDPYYYDLAEWLQTPYHWEYAEQAHDEYGTFETLADWIEAAQRCQFEEIGNELIAELERLTNVIEDDEDDEDEDEDGDEAEA